MELRVLRYFLVVAREENITKAAKILHITQPTLSRQLMQLEDELGIKLFKRSRHNITLSEDGLLLRRRAQEIVTLADKTIDGFLNKQEEIAGEISIGTGEFLSMDYFCQVMSSFHERYPLVRYGIRSDNTEGIEEKIDKGLLDFGVLTETIDISKYDYIHFPQKEQWGILCRKDSSLAKKRVIELSDLDNQTLILPRRADKNLNITNWFENRLNSFEIIGSYNLLYNAAMMVKNGMGIALCMRLNACYENLCFIPLFPALDANVILIWKKDQALPLATATFIEYFKKYNLGISYDEI